MRMYILRLHRNKAVGERLCVVCVCVCVFIPITSIPSLFHTAVKLNVFQSHPVPFFDFL